jgi:hypothetical protein
MRSALLLLLAMLAIQAASAQQQERKLVDRLLRPDMEMKNAAQDKKFVAKQALLERSASVKSFYVRQSVPPGEYPVVRRFPVAAFWARHFQNAGRTASAPTEIILARRAEIDSAASALEIRTAAENNKTAAGPAYAGTRPFLDKGKSQKALSQHDTPLTLEQVRELLNKNK